jgi:hypothetical protein
MPITVEEKYLSQPTKDNGRLDDEAELLSVELHYIVKGTDDGVLAVQAVRDSAPETYEELERGEIAVEPIGPTQWEATVQYNPPVPEEDESTYSFDTGGGTQHITNSLATVGKYGRNYSPIGYSQAIGVTKDSVEGVDITVPTYQFSETHVIANELVTNEYKSRLFQLTGKVNDAAWGGFAAGEVLFMGASGSRRGRKGKWEMTFHFAASPNKTGLTIGEITDVAKGGWEYLWVEFVQEVVGEGGNQRLGWVPDAVFIEQVYPEGDFGDLEPSEPEE